MNPLGAFSRFALVYESVGIVTDLKCVLKSKPNGEPTAHELLRNFQVSIVGLGETFRVSSISTFLSVRPKGDLNEKPCSSIPPLSLSRLGQLYELCLAPLSLAKAGSCCICMHVHSSWCPINRL